MPIKKAAFKHLRQSKQRTKRNQDEKQELKSLFKKTLRLVEQGKSDEAKELVVKTIKAIDKAAQHGVIKKQTASRKKSRFMKQMQKLSAAKKS